ncbi:MAG: bacillithiol system redox-active protein YtxJ, partial [Bacteroidia bacterium]
LTIGLQNLIILQTMSRFDKLFASSSANNQNWKQLKSESQLIELLEESKQKPVAIFKHSTRCGISHMVKDKVESQYDFKKQDLSFYFLDLLNYRPISNAVAQKLNVPHQSPQLILLKGGNVVHNASHHMIDLNNIKTHLRAL